MWGTKALDGSLGMTWFEWGLRKEREGCAVMLSPHGFGHTAPETIFITTAALWIHPGKSPFCIKRAVASLKLIQIHPERQLSSLSYLKSTCLDAEIWMCPQLWWGCVCSHLCSLLHLLIWRRWYLRSCRDFLPSRVWGSCEAITFVLISCKILLITLYTA